MGPMWRLNGDWPNSVAGSGYEAGDIDLFADAPEIMRFRILIQEEAWKNDLEGALA